ncbi:MAG: pantoate--beta-alanine ligase [Candidatus Omnitrophica bacterium]|nr:pantoate--beta-alanine ligase [Candidatus Omnitrophota bacterium]
MKTIRSIKEMVRVSREMRLQGKTIGFVPTMGALHQGHLSLIRKARQETAIVVVSIFVNPTQFQPKEDFKKYPRNLKRDSSLCKREGVDIIFSPKAKAIYPADYRTYVFVQGLSAVLCGKSRPGHFKGVATVVTKLFNIVCPDTTYFGQKDLQQVIIIKRMADDLNMPVKIKVMPTIREKDGLALSSRNVSLNEEERKDATVLYEALQKAKDLIRNGDTDTQSIIGRMRRIINERGITKIDYISIVDLDNLQPLKKITNNSFIALAAWVGKTRLIDNIVIKTYV